MTRHIAQTDPERYEALRRVVEFRDGLQQLWNGAGANQARAVAQLREWCRRAEASGIRALREFARALPAYAR
ncbi:MAG: transposase [Gammaproteobacteria bacterium]|nr:MAG: transposase [Gammaproteobacteria bacterium]